MRIVLTHPFCWPYLRRGTERNMDGLARYLHRQGHDVITLSTCPEGARTIHGDFGKKLLQASRWHPLLGKLRIEATHTFFPDCWRSLARLEPDVVHSFYFTDALAAIMRRKRLGYGTVFQMNGAPVPEAYHRLFPPDRWLIRKAITHCGQRIVCSDFIRRIVRQNFDVDSAAIVPGVDIDEFDLGRGPDDGQPSLLAVGNFDVRRKGVRVLAEAFNLVNARHAHCRLVLSGQISDPVRAQVLDILTPAARECVDITGLGRLEDVPGLYRKASLLVMPAVWEPSGTVMAEAWASGTPVVAADHGGLPEFLNSEVGVLYPPGIADGESTNARGLAEAIELGLALSARAGTREKCREHAQHMSWEAIGPRVEEMYMKAIESAR